MVETGISAVRSRGARRERIRVLLNHRWAVRAGAAALVVGVPALIVGFNVWLLFREVRLYQFAVTHYRAAVVTGIPEPELLRAMGELRDYLFGSEPRLHIIVTTAQGERISLFTNKEAAHMDDVRRLIHGFFRLRDLGVALVGVTVAAWLLRGRQGRLDLARWGFRTGLGFNIAVVLFGAGAVLGFDALFTRFHELFFSEGSWQFDPYRDRLVQLFPFEFWQLSAILLVGLMLIEAAVLAMLSLVALRRMERGQ